LSDRQERESTEARKGKRQRKPVEGDRKARNQRTADVGRALRSAYDDTLRESVPDEFMDLLGKLS
jgi:hypothetical protein